MAEKPGPKKPSKMDEAGRKAVLRAYRRTKNRARAAAAAGVHIGTVDRWLRESPDFREAFEHAGAMYVARLEREADRRAHSGVERQKALGSGEHMTIVTERHYSDAILLRLLERHDKRWRKGEVVEHEGSVSVPLDLDSLTPRQRVLLRELLEAGGPGETPPATSSRASRFESN